MPHLDPPLQMAPYREALGRVLCGAELRGAAYHAVTFASLALFYLVAIWAGSIWRPLQFVGATAGGENDGGAGQSQQGGPC